MKVVALVPIKLNSQRVPKKNILPINDHPLCYHILKTLLDVKKIDKIYVYCSDEDVINYIPEGIEFLKRDQSLDADLVKGFDIYRAFMKQVDADIYVLAHTTSPFLRSESVEDALDNVLSGQFDSAFSAKKIQTFAWYDGEPINYDLNNVPRTQDMKPIYVETSGFYIFKKETFNLHNRRIGFNPYIKEIDDIESIDIDTKEDYEFATLVGKTLKLK